MVRDVGAGTSVLLAGTLAAPTRGSIVTPQLLPFADAFDIFDASINYTSPDPLGLGLTYTLDSATNDVVATTDGIWSVTVIVQAAEVAADDYIYLEFFATSVGSSGTTVRSPNEDPVGEMVASLSAPIAMYEGDVMNTRVGYYFAAGTDVGFNCSVKLVRLF